MRLARVAILLVPLMWPAIVAAQTCGDQAVEGDETCDDGDTVGGDGCAANCTEERRIEFAIENEAHFNAQGRFAQAYGAPGLPLRGALTLTIGAPRSSDPDASVPIVVRDADARIEPVALAGTTCFCARPTAPDDFPSGIVAQGTVGCAEAGRADVDYELSRDHNIIDVDPQCTTGTLHEDGHCIGALQQTFTGGGWRGAATLEMGFRFYELGNCNGTPGDPDQQGCTADDPVSVPTQRFVLTTGRAAGEIINADNTEASIGSDSQCGSLPCDVVRSGSPFDCDAVLTDPPQSSAGALAGVDVAVHLATLDDLVNVLQLPLSGPTAPTATPTVGPTETPTAIGGCAGDCDGGGTVSIGELIRGVNIALATQPLTSCPAFDPSADGIVSVNELIQAVSASLNGCG